MNYKKALFIIGGLAITALVLMIGLVVFSLKTGTKFRPLPPESTGAIIEEIPPEKQLELTTYNDLIDRVPVMTDKFRIEFSFKKDKFFVYLKEPYEINRREFSKWLQENGFEIIGQENFKFYLD